MKNIKITITSKDYLDKIILKDYKSHGVIKAKLSN